MFLKKVSSLKGEIIVPGDKSISHRAIMLASLAKGTSEVSNFLQGADCLSTISCFQNMGVLIENKGDIVRIQGNGLHGLMKPNCILDVGNSGTTMRLLSGILSAQPFDVAVTGDSSIQKRPMNRVITPLSMMGADIKSISDNGCAPLKINGRTLHGIEYTSPVASAQVKSAILLAGMYAEEPTSVTEPYVSRNHTELMLRYYDVDVKTHDTSVTISKVNQLSARSIVVPGDISSAAYFIAAGLIVGNSEILIKNVGINPTRDGMLRVCRQMGANMTLLNVSDSNGEATADILVRSSNLKGTTIGGELIPTLIDELPILAIMACFCEGQTIIKDAAELKVKESNRIDIMVHNLSKMGADIIATEDGMIINGNKPLHGAVIESKMDHRIAMSFAICALATDGITEIKDADCVTISYPNFYQHLNSISVQ